MNQREYVELELRVFKRRLADVEAPGRQVESTPAGREYRAQLRKDIAELEARLEAMASDEE